MVLNVSISVLLPLSAPSCALCRPLVLAEIPLKSLPKFPEPTLLYLGHTNRYVLVPYWLCLGYYSPLQVT